MKMAAYCRVSTDKEEQLDSLEHQKEFFTEYARRHGHELFRLYADEGISGTSLKKRAEFQRMMRDAQLGLFEMVAVKDISRVARNTVDFLQSIRQLKKMGIDMLFVTANMTSLGDSEFILTVFGAMAQEESSNLSKRVKWGKKINAKKGRVPQRIFGYERIDNFTLAINPAEAAIVWEIFRLYVGCGHGCRTISLLLNGGNAKTKLGCEWDPHAVRRVLTNPIYCGHYVNNKYEVEDYLTGRQVRIPEEQHFHHERPEWAIVSPEVFQNAQEILASRRAQSEPPFQQARYSSRHVFSTLIKCEECGRSFCRRSYTYANTRTYWKCRTNDQMTAKSCGNSVKLEESELLEALREYLAERIGSLDVFAAEVTEALEHEMRRLSRPLRSRESAKAQRSRLLRKKERYQEMYANGLIELEELKARLDALEEELRDATAVRQEEAPPAGGEALDKQISGFLAMRGLDNQDMRQIVDHISVSSGGEVRIALKKWGEGTPA